LAKRSDGFRDTQLQKQNDECRPRIPSRRVLNELTQALLPIKYDVFRQESPVAFD
jgi:hypothetical protein